MFFLCRRSFCWCGDGGEGSPAASEHLQEHSWQRDVHQHHALCRLSLWRHRLLSGEQSCRILYSFCKIKSPSLLIKKLPVFCTESNDVFIFRSFLSSVGGLWRTSDLSGPIFRSFSAPWHHLLGRWLRRKGQAWSVHTSVCIHGLDPGWDAEWVSSSHTFSVVCIWADVQRDRTVCSSPITVCSESSGSREPTCPELLKTTEMTEEEQRSEFHSLCRFYTRSCPPGHSGSACSQLAEEKCFTRFKKCRECSFSNVQFSECRMLSPLGWNLVTPKVSGNEIKKKRFSFYLNYTVTTLQVLCDIKATDRCDEWPTHNRFM